MIFAKISPAAEVSVQTGPFSSQVYAANWMGASVRNYVLGQELTTFQVYFGTLHFPTEQEVQQGMSPVPTFTSMYNTLMQYTAQQLSTWGSNDETALLIIATSLNTTIQEYLNVPNINL